MTSISRSLGVASLRRALPGLAFLALGACMPVVTHGPRVEPGVNIGATLGSFVPLCDTCDTALPMMSGWFVRYGYAPSPKKPAALIGVNVPWVPVEEPFEADAYLQAPVGTADFVYGAGALAGTKHVMPYVQVGSTRNGPGLYTTQGFALHGWRESGWDVAGEVRPRYWSPTVAYRLQRSESTLHLYVSGMIGDYERRVPAQDGQWTSLGRQRLLGLTVGVTGESSLRALFPILPPIGGVPRR